MSQADARLSQARQEVARYQDAKHQLAAEQKNSEDRLAQTTNTAERRDLELHIQALKRGQEQVTGEADARAREGEALTQLQAEQGLLTQFRSEMNQLVAALDRAIQQLEGQRKP